MPVVHIEYDDKAVTEAEIQTLCQGIHEIASAVTGIEDVPVYANCSHIKVAVAPIEIFIRFSAHKIKDLDALTAELKNALSRWKTEHHYPHKINMSLIPMSWKIEIGI